MGTMIDSLRPDLRPHSTARNPGGKVVLFSDRNFMPNENCKF